ncbi:hypothetical protein T06_1811 [Trichinella sp. T6]|nr:hypothetical protein T06_1811 [Trichinella sp. T6]
MKDESFANWKNYELKEKKQIQIVSRDVRSSTDEVVPVKFLVEREKEWNLRKSYIHPHPARTPCLLAVSTSSCVTLLIMYN